MDTTNLIALTFVHLARSGRLDEAYAVLQRLTDGQLRLLALWPGR